MLSSLLIIVGVLLVMGLFLYGGPLAGNAPNQAMESLVSTMAVVADETLDSLVKMVQEGDGHGYY